MAYFSTQDLKKVKLGLKSWFKVEICWPRVLCFRFSFSEFISTFNLSRIPFYLLNTSLTVSYFKILSIFLILTCIGNFKMYHMSNKWYLPILSIQFQFEISLKPNLGQHICGKLHLVRKLFNLVVRVTRAADRL